VWFHFNFHTHNRVPKNGLKQEGHSP
jgi:hypothetical protein